MSLMKDVLDIIQPGNKLSRLGYRQFLCRMQVWNAFCVLLWRAERYEFGSVLHSGGVCLGAVHECNEIRNRAGE